MMKYRNPLTRSLGALLGLGLALAGHASMAQAQGFQLNRFEPTNSGEWSFMVDHPWYSSMRRFSAGLTFNYGHNPFQLIQKNSMGTSSTLQTIIEHQLIAHVNLAVSFADRVTLSATVPVTLLERGNAIPGVTPLDSVGVGDPRLGIMVRLFGQPYQGAISMSLGADVWLPALHWAQSNGSTVFANNPQLGDTEVRVRPKVVLGGLPHNANGHGLSWALTGAFYYRPDGEIGSVGPMTTGNKNGMQLQFGAAFAYANLKHRYSIGAEALLGTVIGQGLEFAFKQEGSSLDILPVSFHYNIANAVNIGLAGGVGLWRQPGSADWRVLAQIAYAPMPKQVFACKDSDKDGVCDSMDVCPEEPQGNRPDSRKAGCPLRDRDGDGVYDNEDMCPDVHMGAHPDPMRLGCPMGDRDKDGVLDRDDMCPDVHMGPTPDPMRLGCPMGDRDKDGVLDNEDMCPDMHMGPTPDPKRKGCPAKDTDGDGIYDHEDACIDKPGKPHLDDMTRHGCPDLVVEGNKLTKLERIYFDLDKDSVVTKDPVTREKNRKTLGFVGKYLRDNPQILEVLIEGSADDRGSNAHNLGLTSRRANSVRKWLIMQEKIASDRLRSKGLGRIKGTATDEETRAQNRRIDFTIVKEAK